MLLTILIVAPHLKEDDAAESEQAGGS